MYVYVRDLFVAHTVTHLHTQQQRMPSARPGMVVPRSSDVYYMYVSVRDLCVARTTTHIHTHTRHLHASSAQELMVPMRMGSVVRMCVCVMSLCVCV